MIPGELTQGERELAIKAWAVDDKACRWGNLVLEAYDKVYAFADSMVEEHCEH